MVHRSSETSTNQSDVIIRTDDRFLNPVVDSDSIVSKIYMLNFVFWLFLFLFFFVSILTKILQFYPSCFFSPHTDKHLAVLSKRTFDTQSIHIFGLVYYLGTPIIYLLPRIVHFISGVTHMENDLLFCSKLMFPNGKIIVYKFMIQFYLYLYFCQSYSWNKDYLINYSQ